MSTPDPGGFTRGQHNGHCSVPYSGDLVVADLREYEAPVELSPEFVAEQTRILDYEVAAFLAEESAVSDNESAKSGLLPGFETLTWADLHHCPAWCVHRDSEVHADAFDSDPDSAPHRSTEYVVQAENGGEGIDHAGRAEVTVQLEQARYLSDDPTIVLSVVVDGIEQYTWLTTAETQALSNALGRLVAEAQSEARDRPGNG